jgi:glycosyltransferase involved in cell wall biosynthesis
VTILVLDNTDACFYPLDKKVELIRQGLSFGISREGNIISRKVRFLSDVLKLRRLLTQVKAEVVISTEYPFTAGAILCGTRKRSKVFAWEHHHFHELKKNQFWNRIFYFTYPRLNGIICLNTDEEKIYRKINPHVFVIPNFIRPTDQQSTQDTRTILTIARLNWVKGMDLLVTVAKQVFEKHPGWKWKIIGGGELEDKLRTDISEYHLDDEIILSKPVNHAVAGEYKQAELFVLLSRNECLPMTLLEAQSAGLPCISFDCETGPRHIITNEENGLLVENENPEKMAEAINNLIDDPEKRTLFSRNARSNVMRFTPDKIYSAWEQVILK